MVTRSEALNAPTLAEREDREAILAVIYSSPSITIEELLHHLPWMQWGHLFSVIGECLQEGLVTLCQKEFQFEVRAIQASRSRIGESVLAGPVSSSSGEQRVTI